MSSDFNAGILLASEGAAALGVGFLDRDFARAFVIRDFLAHKALRFLKTVQALMPVYALFLTIGVLEGRRAFH